jgi:maleate isomerase
VSEQQTRWKHDGWEATTRIGVLTADVDVGPESELQAMAPPGVVIHAGRVPFAARSARVPATSVARAREFAGPHADEPVELLGIAPLDAIGYAFVASSYVIGAQGEAEMVARFERSTRGIPVVPAGAATVDALRALDAGRVALILAPWFDPRLIELGRSYYESAGFEVVYSAPCGLPSDQTKITPAELHAWVSEHVSTTDAEARLFRKGPGKEAKLSFMGHLLMENRSGLVVGTRLTQATGMAERARMFGGDIHAGPALQARDVRHPATVRGRPVQWPSRHPCCPA